MAHITGGGFIDNIPRVLPEGIGVKINLGSWEVPALFTLIQSYGNVASREMYRVFNMGIGFVLIVPAEDSAHALQYFNSNGETAVLLGETVSGEGVRLV